MQTITVGAHKLGGETVMMRHEKTLVNRNLFAATLCTCMDDAAVEARLEGIRKVDYEPHLAARKTCQSACVHKLCQIGHADVDATVFCCALMSSIHIVG